MVIFYLVFTMWSLFCQDIKQIFSTPENDKYFDVVSLVCICFFFVDILLQFTCEREYRFSILFLLDLVGLFSIVFTLSFLVDLINSKVTFNIYGLLARGVRFIFVTKIMRDEIEALNLTYFE